MNNPSISILVPICNVERYLRECLDSLVNQTLRDIEIICINDGSTDSSLSIIKEYARRDDRIVVIDKPNSGYGDSMNKGIESASGEYIGIVESDDFASIDMFKKLYKVASDNQLDIVRSNYWAHRTGDKQQHDQLVENLAICGSYDKVFNPIDNPRVFMCQPAIWTSIYRKSLLDENSVRFLPTPGASFQDTAFYFKAFYAASRVMLLKEGYLHYRVDNANSSVKNQNKLFCVCDEYAEVWDYAKRNPRKLDVLKCWIPRQQFEGYLWNLNRLSPELQQRFYPRYVDEFKKISEAGLIDSARFDDRTLSRLNRMITEPEKFFAEQYGSKSPVRTVIAGVSMLSISDAKDVLLSLVPKLSADDEVFVVSPDSEAIVFELKNENEGMGKLRNDADLVVRHDICACDFGAVRAEKLSVVGFSAADTDCSAIASAIAGDQVSCRDDSGFVINCHVDQNAVPLSLVTLLVRELVCLGEAVLGKLPSSWPSFFCSSGLDDSEGFSTAITGAKEFACELFESSASYKTKRLLFGQLLNLWSSVRRAYSALPWDVACFLRESYESMAEVPVLSLDGQSDIAKPEISVIVPVYNVGDYIGACLDSVLGQDYSDFEVICVNDGSIDSSLDYLEETVRRDRRIRVVSQFNCGAGAARNRGIDLAKGRRLIFIDPDDMFANQHVFSDLLEGMNRSGASICGGSLSLLTPSGKLKSNFSFDESFYHVTSERDVPLAEIWTDYGWIRFMYEADLFKDGFVRFPQLNWYEDPVFFLHALAKSGGCHIIPVDVYTYRVGYKEIDWTVSKVRDMLFGMSLNLKLAEKLNLGELYATIVRRFNREYANPIMGQLGDTGVYSQLVDIQQSLNHELFREFSSFDGRYYRLAPLFEEGERAVAIERVASKVAHSRIYTGIQNFIYRIKDRA